VRGIELPAMMTTLEKCVEGLRKIGQLGTDEPYVLRILCRMFGEGMAGLAQLHAHGVVHLDVATRNLLMKQAMNEERGPFILLSDFGSAAPRMAVCPC
jgi:tRNA A-37 threonylcarbamoyl transferase component Bud32